MWVPMNPYGFSRTRNTPTTTSDDSEISSSFAFGSFFEDWLVRQEHYLYELQSAAKNLHVTGKQDLEDLTDRVLSHYQQYYDEKSRIMQTDVSILFSPPWLTRLERAHLWVAGFKPGLVVELSLGSLGGELTQDQARRMEEVRITARMREKELDNEMAQLQESLACPPLLGAARKRGKPLPLNWKVNEEEAAAATGAMRARMEEAVVQADLLRMRIALGVMEILNPGQRVKFLTAVTQLLLRLRTCGLQRDA
ncbi:protein DOG1-like 4 [Punica granatum]|uniref:Protein DOG1-like 4 n=1 Tax=Punica granatum TaxID=22663 RepID=A0A218W3I9_PUNGR|nr:protein DOG1-like 4 [Punica granatum]XP_031398623.1 protein DOG1-like 4 [Punica granatum]XP_031398624.1 protein DOG1-like 4 [Punica granatum]XP_031398625.1 protein DOG1-like 4 [Punica granatum]XP_031398626.1 protein DOG1-like 4 [Punica granatum]XP_031398627.1 protein DOG1-like 4 [Punica granatum]OWM67113.1 hypothetical protein CDL15_Pgr000565 [Punica granatum]